MRETLIGTLLVTLILFGIGASEWTHELMLTSSSPAIGASYGQAVHTFGDYAIVGENFTGGTATIYAMPDQEWVEQARLRPLVGELGLFSFSAALERSVAAVGAPHIFQLGQELNYTDPVLNTSASVYTYGQATDSWILTSKLSSLQPGADGFGYSLSMGGSYLVVGAPYAVGLRNGDGTDYGVQLYDEFGELVPSSSTPAPLRLISTIRTGAVYTYRNVDGIWTATGVLVPFMADEGDRFGWSLDISTDGSRLVVGSPSDTVDGTQGGSAYVYSMDVTTGTWTLESRILAKDELPLDGFGYAVAVDDFSILIGTESASTAYVFQKLSDTWNQDAKLVGVDTRPGDGFGQSVGIFGAYAVIGSPMNMGRGGAYLWELDMKQATWVPLRKLTAQLPGSRMGARVSIGSRYLLIGSPNANHKIGQVLSLTLDADEATQPVADNAEDVFVLIRFSGSSTSMDMVATRKIIADAAETGTAHTEVRIVDLNKGGLPNGNRLFGLQIHFTSSSAVSAGTAAHNLLNALPDIRYRLNAAVGAVSGTAEIIDATPPVVVLPSITIQQVAAIIILILVTLFTTGILVYFTIQRRRVIKADNREFAQMEAEKEARKQEALKKENARKARSRRPGALLRGTKRKDRRYMQAENDAAGLEFTDHTLLGDAEYPASPRHTFSDYDPTESIENSRIVSPGAEDDPTGVLLRSGSYDDDPSIDIGDDDDSRTPIHMDNSLPHEDRLLSVDLTHGAPKIVLGEVRKEPWVDIGSSTHKLIPASEFQSEQAPPPNDGPTISHSDGPTISLDSGPSLAPPNVALSNGPSLSMDSKPLSTTHMDGPSISLNDGPRIRFSIDAPRAEPEQPSDGPSLNFSDGPSLTLPNDGPTINMGPTTSEQDAPPPPRSETNSPMSVTAHSDTSSSATSTSSSSNDSEPLSPTAPTHSDIENDSDENAQATPSSTRRPAGVPRLNLNLGK